MDPYLRRLLGQPPLDRDEEIRLARLARAGDRQARTDLIVAGMRHVVQRALMLGLRGDDLADAVQAGSLGLIRAVDRFEPDRGVRLATYAWSWIGAAIAAQTRPNTSPPPVVDEAQSTFGSCSDLVADLAPHLADVVRLRFGEHVTDVPMSRRETAASLGVTETVVRRWEAEAMRHLRCRLATIGRRAAPAGEADPL